MTGSDRSQRALPRLPMCGAMQLRVGEPGSAVDRPCHLERGRDGSMTVHGGAFLPGRLEASGRQRGGGGVPHQGLAKRRNLRFHAYELLALPHAASKTSSPKSAATPLASSGANRR